MSEKVCSTQNDVKPIKNAKMYATEDKHSSQYTKQLVTLWKAENMP